MENNICQSCGMPIDKDPGQGGTNADQSKSDTYCSYCYADGRFRDEGISLRDKIEKNIHLAVTQLGIPESEARQNAEHLLPTLTRWRS